MKKRLSLCVRAFFSLIHIVFAKITNAGMVKGSLIQDLALSVKLHPHDGGRIVLKKHIHASRNVVFEAEGGELQIGEGCFFNNGCMAVSHESITIGDYTSFGPNVFIYDHDHVTGAGEKLHGNHYKTAPVTIGSNVWVGANCVILRGTVIEDDCVIGAGSIIKGKYKKGSVVIQKRNEEIREKREEAYSVV